MEAPTRAAAMLQERGTGMAASPLPLPTGVPASWLQANGKNGLSSSEVPRALGGMQQTAWFLRHHMRSDPQDPAPGPLGGEVEAAQPFLGGTARFMHKAVKARTIPGPGGAGQTAVLGL